MKTIRSRAHEKIKYIAKLHHAKERRAQGLFIAEGIRVIASLIESKLKLEQLYCLEDNRALLDEAQTFCKDFQYDPIASITLVSQPVLEKITCLTSSSGIVGIFHIPPQKPLSQLSHGIVLADIQSPGNMGTIIRTAAALKAPSVVLVQGTDVWGPKVVQAAAGTLGMVELFECSWEQLIASKKELQLCALVVRGGVAPEKIDASCALLVVGNEAHGLPQTWVADCDKKITLSMPGGTESLNAALALSITMYICFVHCKM